MNFMIMGLSVAIINIACSEVGFAMKPEEEANPTTPSSKAQEDHQKAHADFAQAVREFGASITRLEDNKEALVQRLK